MFGDFPVVMFEKGNKAHADIQVTMNRRIPNAGGARNPEFSPRSHEGRRRGRVIKKLRALRGAITCFLSMLSVYKALISEEVCFTESVTSPSPLTPF